MMSAAARRHDSPHHRHYHHHKSSNELVVVTVSRWTIIPRTHDRRSPGYPVAPIEARSGRGSAADQGIEHGPHPPPNAKKRPAGAAQSVSRMGELPKVLDSR